MNMCEHIPTTLVKVYCYSNRKYSTHIYRDQYFNAVKGYLIEEKKLFEREKYLFDRN